MIKGRAKGRDIGFCKMKWLPKTMGKKRITIPNDDHELKVACWTNTRTGEKIYQCCVSVKSRSVAES